MAKRYAAADAASDPLIDPRSEPLQSHVAASLKALNWLSPGAFAIGLEGFTVAGPLPSPTRDLDVSLPAVGHLGLPSPWPTPLKPAPQRAGRLLYR